jgi:hypothetical protein
MGEIPLDANGDPELSLSCPSCERGFPAGLTDCPYCGDRLVGITTETEGNSETVFDPHSYCPLIGGLSDWKAQMIAQSLEKEKIPCIKESSASTIGPEILGTMGPYFGLMVRRSDLQRAREILLEIEGKR